MSKILFLGSISKKKNRLDGVTIKSRTLLKCINEKFSDVICIDTDNWKSNFMKIAIKFFLVIKDIDFIVISAADRGSYIILRFLNLINSKKNIYYFVAGGRLGERVLNGEYKNEVFEICNNIYVESIEMQNQLEKANLKNINTMNNFRNIEKRKVCSLETKETIRFIYFGRVIHEKGIEDSLIVFNNLLKKGYDLEYHIYGQVDNAYLNSLKVYLNEKIKYKGAYIPNGKNEYEIFSNYDVFVLPTKYEGECLPGSLIEAYVVGLAIIASKWRYAEEYIKDNKVGYLYKFRDLDDFERKVEFLLNNKEEIKEMKKNSRNCYKNFDADFVLKNFYENLKGR